MITENVAPDQSQIRWIIDMDWYEKNNRSFEDTAQRGMCVKCAAKLGKKKKKNSSADILSSIKECCSQLPEFIPPKLPIAESIFRILLASGNQPTTAYQIGRQLSERRGGDTYAGDIQMITRLLKNDNHYGFKRVEEK